ncbi:MAG: uracil phosphoribosyltransferase [Candidatus Thalassarchaeaceae archaeon]|jgi:uracil phosphoribosyltransferase|nr:uracil phosphoribosyltransferase [Candidatus Thalassarchaeaceae archaeon]MDP7312682.1 uracil phosphoribosyltransferase [Candidatus Thalassarchaeaceae archaeon]
MANESDPMVIVPEHALIAHKLTRLRDRETSSVLFRNLAREITQILMSEATRDLSTTSEMRETPLTTFSGESIVPKIGIVPILRAGLGMSDTAHEMLPMARVLHVGLFRDEETLEPVYYYDKLPTPPNVDLALVVDPMLATGGSAIACISRLKETGISDIRFIGLIAAPEGIAALRSAHPDVKIWMAAIDERLNEQGYIVPGLGDAGDRIMDT